MCVPKVRKHRVMPLGGDCTCDVEVKLGNWWYTKITKKKKQKKCWKLKLKTTAVIKNTFSNKNDNIPLCPIHTETPFFDGETSLNKKINT